MVRRILKLTFIVAIIAATGIAALTASAAPPGQGDAQRGAYIFAASGGCGCHMGQAGFLAGNTARRIKGPFGDVSFPNITPDKETGIGGWTDQQIMDAIRLGKDPEGGQLFPVMPYPAFSGMSDQDAQDLVAYLRTVPPVKNAVPATQLAAPLPPFTPHAPAPAVAPTEGAARGAYLVNAVSACGDCHTPKNPDGSPDMSKFLAGAFSPDTGVAPNITPDQETGIGGWTDEQIATLIRTGARPDSSQVTGLMAEVIGGYKAMTADDALAIAAYLKSIPAVKNTPQAPQELPVTGAATGHASDLVVFMVLLGSVVVLAGFALRRRSYQLR